MNVDTGIEAQHRELNIPDVVIGGGETGTGWLQQTDPALALMAWLIETGSHNAKMADCMDRTGKNYNISYEYDALSVKLAWNL